MFRIGEFSRLTQVSIRMLRYYDEVGILKPAEVDKWTGHRLYSVEQIPCLNKILYLRDSGLNISEIALALRTDDQSLLTQLDKKRLEIECAIQAEQEKLKKIELAKSELQGGKGEYHYNISSAYTEEEYANKVSFEKFDLILIDSSYIDETLEQSLKGINMNTVIIEMNENRVEKSKNYINDIIYKPVSKDDINKIIYKYINEEKDVRI